ncbi:MAG: adenylyltransferase/cytidyltransferase family protein [Candidatus Eremiobacteraeota bacterium]|nr:adenylyltransferase/cytidyltransferase family protein [Candidatus Eremiobacteraeota bacterium]
MNILPVQVGRLAMIARWKPVHLGHQAVLQALVEYADEVVIGIGSSNRYDRDNPFTVAETRRMLELVLAGRDNFEIDEFPDLGHGPRWRQMVVDRLGPLDLFVTANGYVRSLLLEDYQVIHPVHLVPEAQRQPINATMVRQAMLVGEPWQHLVPGCIEKYLIDNGLDRRYREEFGC